MSTVAGTVAAETLPVGARLGITASSIVGARRDGRCVSRRSNWSRSAASSRSNYCVHNGWIPPIAYFEVERQLLAQMRHPAIAQIFDAGTTPDGHPYFAMEFIESSLLPSIATRMRYPLQARIALFIRVCEGVQHAHQKGVIIVI